MVALHKYQKLGQCYKSPDDIMKNEKLTCERESCVMKEAVLEMAICYIPRGDHGTLWGASLTPLKINADYCISFK